MQKIRSLVNHMLPVLTVGFLPLKPSIKRCVIRQHRSNNMAEAIICILAPILLLIYTTYSITTAKLLAETLSSHFLIVSLMFAYVISLPFFFFSDAKKKVSYSDWRLAEDILSKFPNEKSGKAYGKNVYIKIQQVKAEVRSVYTKGSFPDDKVIMDLKNKIEEISLVIKNE